MKSLATRYTEGIDITNEDALITKITRTISIPISFDDIITNEVDTGFVLPKNSVISSVYITVNTGETAISKVLTVGTASGSGGDPAGFLFNVSTGFMKLEKPTLFDTIENTGPYIGVADATPVTPVVFHEPYVVPADITLVWTASATDWVSFKGNIIFDMETFQ